jgi:hypothetical protein
MMLQAYFVNFLQFSCGYVFVCVCVCVCVLLGIESRALFMLHVKRDKTEIYYIIKIF